MMQKEMSSRGERNGIKKQTKTTEAKGEIRKPCIEKQ